MTEVSMIPVDQIHEIEGFNPRTEDEQRELERLASSIESQGLVTALTVRKNDDGYALIAGHRRFKAAKMAGVSSVPCMIRVDDDDQAFVAAITENIHRRDLSLSDQVGAVRKLREKGYTSRKAITAALSISDKRAKQLMQLSELPEALAEWAMTGSAENVDSLYKVHRADSAVATRLSETYTGDSFANALAPHRLNPGDYHPESGTEIPRYEEAVRVIEIGETLTIRPNTSSDCLTDENRGRAEKLAGHLRSMQVRIDEDAADVANSMSSLVEIEGRRFIFGGDLIDQLINDIVAEQLSVIEERQAIPEEIRQKQEDDLEEKIDAEVTKRVEAAEKAQEAGDAVSVGDMDPYYLRNKVRKEISPPPAVSIYSEQGGAGTSPVSEEKTEAQIATEKDERKAERDASAVAKEKAFEINERLQKAIPEKLDEVKATPELIGTLVRKALESDGLDYYLRGFRYLDPANRIETPKKDGTAKVEFEGSKQEIYDRMHRWLDGAVSVEEILGRFGQLVVASALVDNQVEPRSKRVGVSFRLRQPVDTQGTGGYKLSEKGAKQFTKAVTSLKAKIPAALRKQAEDRRQARRDAGDGTA